MPNVIVNCPAARAAARPPRFFCGDWGGLAAAAAADGAGEEGKYDLVLTAETIYSSESVGACLCRRRFPACRGARVPAWGTATPDKPGTPAELPFGGAGGAAFLWWRRSRVCVDVPARET